MLLAHYQDPHKLANLKPSNNSRYNPDLPEQVTTLMIRGDVEDVLRDADRTEVIVQVNNITKTKQEEFSVQIGKVKL